MEELQALAHGFNVALTPINVGLMFIGVLLGTFVVTMLIFSMAFFVRDY